MKVHYYIYLIIAGTVLLSGCNNSSLREKEYAEYQQFTRLLMHELEPYFPYTSNDSVLTFANVNSGQTEKLYIIEDKIGNRVQQKNTINEYEYQGGYSGLYFECFMGTIFNSGKDHISYSVYVQNRTRLSTDSLGTIYWQGVHKPLETDEPEHQYRKTTEEYYINLNQLSSYLPDSIMATPYFFTPTGYMVIVRHKGLTEFSLDGHEIWRLVE